MGDTAPPAGPAAKPRPTTVWAAAHQPGRVRPERVDGGSSVPGQPGSDSCHHCLAV